MLKRVYSFDEGKLGMKALLGGKGANLAEMMTLGLPIPPGFTVTTEACRACFASGGRLPEGLLGEIVIVHGIMAAEGVLTSRGGMTSHAVIERKYYNHHQGTFVWPTPSDIAR